MVGKRRRSSSGGSRQHYSVSRTRNDISGEARKIIRRALADDSRVAVLGSLVFFSTATGDAWMLDSEDGLALCLARGYAQQPYSITETPDKFAVAWSAEYKMGGEVFVVSDLNSGRTQSIIGYPVVEISQAVETALAQSWGRPTRRI